jgi:hypothetical protein
MRLRSEAARARGRTRLLHFDFQVVVPGNLHPFLDIAHGTSARFPPQTCMPVRLSASLKSSSDTPSISGIGVAEIAPPVNDGGG